MSYFSLLEYFDKPNPPVSKENMWDLIDSYSLEELYCKPEQENSVYIQIPIPPLDYKGVKTKGFLYSQALPVILQRFPNIKDLFITCANTMWSSYSWCEDADAYFVCYKNKEHERYYKKKYPYKKDIIYLPYQDGDWTNENQIAPVFNTKKKYDALLVSSAYEFKNTWMFADAVLKYEQKYGKKLKACWIIGNKDIVLNEDGSLDFSKARSDVQKEMQKVLSYMPNIQDYIEVHPYVNYKDMLYYYTASKCSCLTSLIEGKNRSLHEALCCNTPAVIFKDLNKFTRGVTPLLPKNSFEQASKFSAESFADAIHKVLLNPNKYTPREAYIKTNGRINTVNNIAKEIPYFKKNIPGYKENHLHENVFMNMACQMNYQISYYDFIYDKNPAISSIRGLDNIREILKFYYSRFNIPFREINREPIFTPLINGTKSKISTKAPKEIFDMGNVDDTLKKVIKGKAYTNILSKSQVGITNVTYEPNSKSNWHTCKNAGQVLLVLEGSGYFQSWGSRVQKIKKGDVINIKANTKHWHGAAHDKWLNFLEIQEPAKDACIHWLEEVSDTKYRTLK